MAGMKVPPKFVVRAHAMTQIVLMYGSLEHAKLALLVHPSTPASAAMTTVFRLNRSFITG